MSAKYTDLPLTKFPPDQAAPSGLTPAQLTEWAKEHADPMWLKKDVDQPTIAQSITQYQNLMNAGNLAGAQTYLTSHPELLEYFLNADTINRLSQQITALQRFYLEDFAAYVRMYVNQVPDGSTSTAGVLQLANELSSDQTKAVTPYAVQKGAVLNHEGEWLGDYFNPNTIITPGTYFGGAPLNTPAGVDACRLVVIRLLNPGQPFFSQEIIDQAGRHFNRFTQNSGATWSAWGNPATYS